jgi:hypothetical protein
MQKSHVRAVAEAVDYREEVRAAMRSADKKAKFNPIKDLAVGVVYVPEGATKTVVVPLDDSGIETLKYLVKEHAKVIGILFVLIDHEDKNTPRSWARVYIRDKSQIDVPRLTQRAQEWIKGTA